jgi:hypothetical protein
VDTNHRTMEDKVDRNHREMMNLLRGFIDSTKARFEEVDVRLEGLETRMREGFEGVDGRIDELAYRVSQVEVSFLTMSRGTEEGGDHHLALFVGRKD